MEVFSMKFKLLLLLSCVGASVYSMQSSLNLSNEALLNKLQAMYARAEKQAPREDNDFFACAHPGCGFWSTDQVRYHVHAKSHNRANKRRLDDSRRVEAQEIAAILAALSLSEPHVAALTPQALQSEIVSPLLPPSPARAASPVVLSPALQASQEDESLIVSKRVNRRINDTQELESIRTVYALDALPLPAPVRRPIAPVTPPSPVRADAVSEEFPIVTKRSQRVIDDSDAEYLLTFACSQSDEEVNNEPAQQSPTSARPTQIVLSGSESDSEFTKQCIEYWRKKDEARKIAADEKLTAVKKFICEECGYAYARKCELSRHEKGHTISYPCQYPRCHTRVKYKGNLWLHEKACKHNPKNAK